MGRVIFAYLGLAVSCLGFLLFLALGIWIWAVKAEVNRQSDALAERANKTLDSAERANGYVRDIIGKAQVDLAETRREIGGQPAPAVNPVVRMTAVQASQNLAGSVERAHNAVVMASEAVVVADAALDVVGGVPELKQLLGVKPEELDATRTALGNVSNELQQARDVLGVPNEGQPTNEQLHTVDDAIHRASDFTDEVGKVVESTRVRVNETKHTVDVWALRGAMLTSIISVFGVMGQFFMGRYFWQLLNRNSRRSSPTAATGASHQLPQTTTA